MDTGTGGFARTLIAASGLLLMDAAQAAGYQVLPTASSGARLLAGNGILGEEAGDMYFNAAGLALQPAGHSAQLGVSWLKLKTDFTGSATLESWTSPTSGIGIRVAGNTDTAEDTATPIGNFFVHRNGADGAFTWGIGLTTPYGLIIDYDPDWLGRYQAITSELRVFDLNGAVAWKLDDRLTLGAGVSVQYADALLSQAVPAFTTTEALVEIRGDSVGHGANVGLIYQLRPQWRLGASYRSMVSHRLEGERDTLVRGELIGQVGARTTVHIPEFALLSALYAPADEPWSLAAGLRYTNWSRFEELRVDFADGTTSLIPQGWEDSWTGSLSADYRLTPRDKLILSYSYDASPVPGAELRSARIPDTHRNLVGFGYQRRDTLCEGCELYLSYHRTMLGKSGIRRREYLSPTRSMGLYGQYERTATNVFAAHFIARF